MVRTPSQALSGERDLALAPITHTILVVMPNVIGFEKDLFFVVHII